MKTQDQVTDTKLRGGFYSPSALVTLCWDRVHRALPAGQSELIILEPSAGDGAFIHGLSKHPLKRNVKEFLAVEINEVEARKCAKERERAGIAGSVRTASLFDALDDLPNVDVAVGNPPFVRFQFVAEHDRNGALRVASNLGISFAGVSNLWIPLLLGAMGRIRDGGAFAFIVPFECFTGISAKVVRDWLLANVADLHVDIFAAKSFPGVLQEVVVLSGTVQRGIHKAKPLAVYDHATDQSWVHEATSDAHTWTGYLLSPKHLEALALLSENEAVHRFREIARLTVATVTGANEYFSLSDERCEQFDLVNWRRPLLARIRHAPGLRFNEADFKEAGNQRLPRWILDTDVSPKALPGHHGLAAYVAKGEAKELHKRFKCRIRDPWYKVPIVRPGSLLLSKRSHRYPRLVLNEVDAVTTDTIYQGAMLPAWNGWEHNLVAGFHNSLTLLSAEIEGRSFGGGVLELVPSEVGRLLVPMIETDGALDTLDSLVRSHGTDTEDLVVETDKLIVESIAVDPETMSALHDARQTLLVRRLGRSQ